MKALWFLGLLIVLPVVNYSAISGAEIGFRQPPGEMPASPFLASSLLSPRNKNDPAVNLADYVFLHDTRNASISAYAPAVVRACS